VCDGDHSSPFSEKCEIAEGLRKLHNELHQFSILIFIYKLLLPKDKRAKPENVPKKRFFGKR
jgi:hypothetical protein